MTTIPTGQKGSESPAGAPPSREADASASLASLRILMLLCVVVPLVVFIGSAAFRHHTLHAEAELRLDRALRIATEHALKVLETNEALLERVNALTQEESSDQLRARQQQLHEQLAALARGKPQLQAIGIVDEQGRPLASSRFSEVPPQLDVSDREYFKIHQQGRSGVYVTEPLSSRLSGQALFTMSLKRTDRSGNFAGVVAVGLYPDYFARFHADLVADEPGLAITMLRDDGKVYSRWPQLKGMPPSLAPNSPVMSRIRQGATGGQAHGVSSLDGKRRLLLFQKVGSYPVYLGTGMDLAAVRASWLREMGTLAAFGTLPVLGLLVAAWVASRRTREALAAAEELRTESVARRQVEEALLQAQKLEAMGRLTGGVAHDFNNALMVISSNLFLLKRLHPEAAGKQTDGIARAVDSATKLTRQLLAFSRKQALVPEVVRLQERLPALTELFAPVLGSTVQLTVQAEPDTRAIMVDIAELELALLNLAVNARDAMPGNGSFLIVARNARDAELPPLLKGPMVVIEAADSGSGIPPEVLAKVFDPFFTTKPVGEGTGLGLSQVYGLCRRAGGLAAIESEPGRGTTVRMFFPATQAQAPDAHSAAPGPQGHLGKRVLLVEDNPEVAAALQPVLEAMGCSVVRMDRGTSARDWLARQEQLPDVVLSDVVMPGEMDGLALAQHIRESFPSLRVVLMSGYAEQLEAIARHGFEVLPKPCSAEMLAEALGRAPAAGAASPQ